MSCTAFDESTRAPRADDETARHQETYNLDFPCGCRLGDETGFGDRVCEQHSGDPEPDEDAAQ